MIRSIGKSSTGPLNVDLDILLKTRLLVTASSGAGKTGTLYAICEAFADQVQIIVLDWEGEFAPLRARYPFILVGPDGETPASVNTSQLLAHRLLELNVSAICDIYELPNQQKHEFVRDFLSSMIDAPKKLWHPVLVIVDEAHLVAPEKGQGESVAAQSVIDMASRGRKRGFCLIAATQRLAKLSKNVAAECQNVLVGRTTQVDQSRAADVLNMSGKQSRDEFGRMIGRMPTAEFVAYGMAFGATEPQEFKVSRPHTLPSTDAKRLIVPPTPSSIRDLLPQLADLPTEVAQKVKTEEDLRAEIRDLRQQLKQQVSTNPATPVIDQEREQMWKDHLEQVEKQIERHEVYIANLRNRLSKAREVALQLATILSEEEVEAITTEYVRLPKPAMLESLTTPKPAKQSAQSAKPRPIRPPSSTLPADGDPLSGPEQRILDSIAWFEEIGVAQPEQPAVAFMAGYTYGAGGYNNPRGRLNQRGLVMYLPGDHIQLTKAGQAVANYPDIAPTNRGLQEAILSKLGGPEQRILQPLLKSYPRGMDNVRLAEAAGYTPGAGGYNNPRGRLKSLGLVEYRDGQVFARDILFPEQ